MQRAGSRGSEFGLDAFYWRGLDWREFKIKVRIKVKNKVKIKVKNKVKINVKGNGQECPFYTGSSRGC
jgi:hypothetical protein